MRFQSQEWILAQSIVIVEILVAQRQRVDPLPDHLFHAVLDQDRIPPIEEAPAEPRQQVHLRVGFLQHR